METKQIDLLLQDYLDQFGELPPADMVISYYSDFYVELIKSAIQTGEKITPKILENTIGDMPYDVEESKEKSQPTKRPQDLIENDDEE